MCLFHTQTTTGTVTVDGFYDGVRPLTDVEASKYGVCRRCLAEVTCLPSLPVYLTAPTLLAADLHFDAAAYLASLGTCRVCKVDPTLSPSVAALFASASSPAQSTGAALDATRLLLQRWRVPSLSAHSITTSAASSSVIPHKVTASISVRTVSGQDTDEMEAAVVSHLNRTFSGFSSGNTLTVACPCTWCVVYVVCGVFLCACA